MAPKRHFTGKPIGQEYESSSESELESEREEEVEQQKNIKANIQINPIKRQVVRQGKVVEDGVQKIDSDSIRKGSSEEDDDDEENEGSDEIDDSDSSDDSSDDEPKLLKPVFLSKNKRARVSKPTTTSKKEKALEDRERTLKTIEAHINQDKEYEKKLQESAQNYGGIDDTDDLDPESEKAEWELRQLKREERDRAKLENEQDELEENENRRLRTEEERDEEYRQKIGEEEAKVDEHSKPKPKGAFFRDQKLLKRDLGEENEKYDKKTLLPQRFKPETLGK